MEQRKFAELIGSTDKIISKWRTSGLKSYRKYLPRIAEVLNTTVDYLLSGDEKKPAPASKNGGELDRDTIVAVFMGGDVDMSLEERDVLRDDMYEYARLKTEQRKKKKDQGRIFMSSAILSWIRGLM